MREFATTLKDNWMVVLVAVVAFGFLAWHFPHSDMGKATFNEIDIVNRYNAVSLYQFGLLSEEDKQWYMNNLGMSEEDFNPLRQFIEKTD